MVPTTLKIGCDARVNGVLVRVSPYLWGREVWLVVCNPAADAYWQRAKYLTADGSWIALSGAGIRPLFKTLEQVEEALALGALSDWNGTIPNPDPYR